MRISLDTSAYSNLYRAVPEVVDVVSNAEWIGLSAVVVGELESGFRRGSQRAKNNESLRTNLYTIVEVEVLPVDWKVAEIYGDIHNELLSKGNPIPTNDIWIAASSVGYGSTLVTFDKHFQRISSLGVITL